MHKRVPCQLAFFLLVVITFTYHQQPFSVVKCKLLAGKLVRSLAPPRQTNNCSSFTLILYSIVTSGFFIEAWGYLGALAVGGLRELYGFFHGVEEHFRHCISPCQNMEITLQSRVRRLYVLVILHFKQECPSGAMALKKGAKNQRLINANYRKFSVKPSQLAGAALRSVTL